MSTNRQLSNKDRTTNFAKEETTKLIKLLDDYPIITCKKTDHSSNQQKDAAWKSLCDIYNSDGSRHRTIKQLQQKYNNMKKTARKEMAAEKYGRRQTGGGPAPPKPSEATEWLNSIMGESISGLPAVYDSDANDISNVGTETTTRDCASVNIHFIDDEILDPSTSQISIPLIKDKDWEEVCDENTPNIKEASNVFDSSTPKAMLRKPVSKELSVSHNKRKTSFNPLETRKRIIMHTDKKIEFLKQKQSREVELLNYAKEEHEKNMLHKEEAHQKAMQQMEEKHRRFIQQQEELHQIEVEIKKKMLENIKSKE